MLNPNLSLHELHELEPDSYGSLALVVVLVQ